MEEAHFGYISPQWSNLPGDENNNIACLTCHDPHSRVIIKGRVVYDAHLGEQVTDYINEVVMPKNEKKIYLSEKAKKPLRLPIEHYKLCINCHVEQN